MNSSLHWHVLYTTPRSELKVLDGLLAAGFEAYCPTRMERRQWSDRVKKIKVCLLPSMVLVRVTKQNKNGVFNVRGVLRYMHFQGKHAKVRQVEVDTLKLFLEQKHHLKQSLPNVGDLIDVPVLRKKGELLRIEGNECWVCLRQLGVTIRFRLAA